MGHTGAQTLHACWEICAAGTFKSADAAGDVACTACGAGAWFCPGGATQRTNCPPQTSGWVRWSGVDWTKVEDCWQSQTESAISVNCNGGVLSQNATSTTTWGTTVVATALSAVAGAYVNNHTCTQCVQGSYSVGGTATACIACQPGANGANGTTSAAGETSCNANCTNSDNVETWKMASWAPNVMTDLCAAESCSGGHIVIGINCVPNTGSCGAYSFLNIDRPGGGTLQLPLYGTRITTPSIVIEASGSQCFADLQSGSGTGTGILRIEHGGSPFHATGTSR